MGTAPEQLRKQNLSLIDVVAQSVGFMGPVLSVAVAVPLIVGAGPAGKGAGTATPLAILLAGLGVAGIGWTVSRFARRIHAAGALYDYVTDAFGERVGFVAGWIYYLGTVVLSASVSLVFGGVAAEFLASSVGLDVAWWVLGLGYGALLFLGLFLGVRVSTRLQLALAGVSVLAVLAFAVSVILRAGDSNSLGPFRVAAAADGWSGLLYGLLYAILTFTGFEGAASLAEETDNPERSIPRAVLLSIGFVGAYYVIVAYAQAVGFGFDAASWASSGTPLLVLAAPERYGSRHLSLLIQLMVVLDVAAVGIGTTVTATRGLFGMARDRRLPEILATVDRRRGTPVVAISFVVLLGVVATVAVRASHGLLSRATADPVVLLPEWFPVFAWSAGLGGTCVVVVYAMVCVGGARRLWDTENRIRLLLATGAGLLASLGALWGSVYKAPPPTDTIPWVVAFWAALGVVLALGRKPRAGRRTGP